MKAIKEAFRLDYILPVIIFFLLGLWGILHHEMWRDEFQAWLIASNSHSIPELFFNIRYEGHPAVWFLLLYAVDFIFGNPLSMQFLHLVIASSVIYIIFRFSPFSLLQKCLLALSYYMFFEYNIISRNYAIGVLLFLSFIIIFPDWRRHVLKASIILALLSNTNIYGTMISVACGIILLADIVQTRPLELKKNIFAGAFIFIFGLAAAFFVMKPAEDAGNDVQIEFSPLLERLSVCTGNVFNAFFPVPDFKDKHFWNTNFISYDYNFIKVIIVLGILFFSVKLFSKDRRLLLFFILGLLFLFLFNYLTYLSFIRHIGHYFIFWLGCFWLSKTLIKEETKKAVNIGFIVILGIQVLAGIFCFLQDVRRPFSESERVVKFIKQNNLQENIITGVPDYIISPYSVFFNKPVYYLERDSFGTFVKWDKKRKLQDGQSAPLQNLVKLSSNTKKDILFLLDHELTVNKDGVPQAPTDFYLQEGIRLQLLSNFNRAIVGDENYVVYKITNENK